MLIRKHSENRILAIPVSVFILFVISWKVHYNLFKKH